MKVSIIQTGIRNRESKRERIERVNEILLTLQQSNFSPDLIILPEVWACGFLNFSDYQACAEEPDGPFFMKMQELSVRFGCMIHTGSFIEKDNGRLYNTSLLFDSQGSLLAKYRKVHLFGFESEEQKLLTRGEEIITVQTEFGVIGMATCYDLRFPEQFRLMADKDTDICLVSSAWPMQRLNHWRLFNQVRALENQCFLISCNCSFESEGSAFAGHSMCVSPVGDILYEAGEEPVVLNVHIDPEQSRKYKETFPALQDRISL